MKTKRTLIISAAIMALALVVTLVSISAAWFGDIKHQETSRELYVSSQRPMGEATIDLSSAESLNDGTADLVPAKAVNGWLLGGGTPTTGAALQTANVGNGIQTAATVVPIFFPFSYGGTADSGVADGKKAIKIYINTAYIKVGDNADDSVNYLDDFYITLKVVKNVHKETTIVGNEEHTEIVYQDVTSATAAKSGDTVTFTGLVSGDDSIYFINDVDDKSLYILLPPDSETYSVKVEISYNYLDEELNHATVNKTIVFGVHIQVIERDDLVDAVYDLL